MKRLGLIMVVALTLCGCAHTTPAPVIITAPCPSPPIVTRPHLPAADLTANSSPADVMRALIASQQLLQGYAAELETILDGYRTAPMPEASCRK